MSSAALLRDMFQFRPCHAPGGMSSCRGQPEAGDQTIAAFLRRIRAEDGAPLPELRFWSELSIFFFAGASSRSPQPCRASSASE